MAGGDPGRTVRPGGLLRPRGTPGGALPRPRCTSRRATPGPSSPCSATRTRRSATRTGSTWWTSGQARASCWARSWRSRSTCPPVPAPAGPGLSFPQRIAARAVEIAPHSPGCDDRIRWSSSAAQPDPRPGHRQRVAGQHSRRRGRADPGRAAARAGRSRQRRGADRAARRARRSRNGCAGGGRCAIPATAPSWAIRGARPGRT